VASRDLVVPTSEPVRFEIPGLGSITGIVMNAAGRPLPWRIVVCRLVNDTTPIGPVISDAKGRFQLGGLPPGTYVLDVFGYDNRSFPAYFTDRSKQPIGSAIATVALGQLVTDVRIATTFVDGELAGVVTTDDGKPVPGALVTYTPENPKFTAAALLWGSRWSSPTIAAASRSHRSTPPYPTTCGRRGPMANRVSDATCSRAPRR